MALIVRQGPYIEFDPSKLRAGEWAVVLANDPGTKDGKAVYICFSAGNVKRMATYEDMVDEIHNATGDVSEEITKELQAKIKEASEMISEGNVVITNAEKAVGNAEAAAKLANDTAADIQQKLNDGEFSAKITGVTAVTGEAGTQAKVENVGTIQDANFVFTIPKGEPGEPFRVKKTYPSIADMEIGFYTDTDVLEGQFVVIDTGNVEDEDNAKLYMKGQTQYVYITDLSGATGLTGPQGPQGQAAGFGTPTATVDANVGVPSVTVTASGSDTEKVFRFEFHNLKGEPGAKGAIDENSTITFSTAEVRQNIQSGETLKIIMGKMEKIIADLKQVAFTASYNDLVDTPEIPMIPESLPANGGNADTIGNKDLNYIMNYNNLDNKPEIPIIPDVPMALPNPQSLIFTGAVTGSYNGSTEKTVNIPAAPKRGTFFNNDTVVKWFKVASIDIQGAYMECLAVFKVNSVFEVAPITEYGILTVRVRRNNTGLSSSQAVWEYASEAVNLDNFVVTWEKGGSIAELWMCIPTQYCSYTFTVLSESQKDYVADLWQIHNNIAYDSYNDLGNIYHPQVGRLNSELFNQIGGAVSHNHIYRGERVQKYFEDGSLFDRISNGSFDDLYIGDYFDITISTEYTANETVRCVIAGFDYYWMNGDTAFTRHHAVIVTKNCFSKYHAMNGERTTDGGYYGSDMQQIILPVYANAIKQELGDNMLEHRMLLSDEVNVNIESNAGLATKGTASKMLWCSVYLSLLSEMHIYGANVFSSSFNDVGIDNLQLPLFSINPAYKICKMGGTENAAENNRMWYWLRNVSSADTFAQVYIRGQSSNGFADATGGVRPVFCIG